MPGTATNQLNTEYLQGDDFYDGDGCYTFEVTVTNTFAPAGGSTTQVSSDSWNIEWDNENSGGSGTNNEMTTC